jgi:hypothetical protein
MAIQWLQSYAVMKSVDQCSECQALVERKYQRAHENFHVTFGHKKEVGMSKVSWCDTGEHAFKAGENGSASFEGVQYEDGRPVNRQQDVCAKHNPYNATAEIEKAITSRVLDSE